MVDIFYSKKNNIFLENPSPFSSTKLTNWHGPLASIVVVTEFHTVLMINLFVKFATQWFVECSIVVNVVESTFSAHLQHSHFAQTSALFSILLIHLDDYVFDKNHIIYEKQFYLNIHFRNKVELFEHVIPRYMFPFYKLPIIRHSKYQKTLTIKMSYVWDITWQKIASLVESPVALFCLN